MKIDWEDLLMPRELRPLDLVFYRDPLSEGQWVGVIRSTEVGSKDLIEVTLRINGGVMQTYLLPRSNCEFIGVLPDELLGAELPTYV